MLHSRGWRALLARVTSAPAIVSSTPPSAAEPQPEQKIADVIVPRAMRPMSLLWVEELLPDPARDSGSLRMFNLLRLLVAMGHSVHVLTTSRIDDPAHRRRVRDIGVHCVSPAAQGPARWFERQEISFGAVIVSRYHLAQQWFPLVRSVNPDALRILDTVDLHHVRELREATLRGKVLMRLAANATRRQELRAIQEADVTWVVSDVERRILKNELPEAQVEVISNVHELPPPTNHHERGAHLLFVGGAHHPPNADGVRWLLAEVMPRILVRRPECKLHLVGLGLEGCAGDLPLPPGVVFHGHLHDLGSLLRSCCVGLAPLRFGAGVKGKINQYMAFGLPTIATPNAIEGMHLRDGLDVLVAGDAADFADAVIRLLEDRHLWETLAHQGRENVRRHFSMESAIPGIQATFLHQRRNHLR